MNFNGLRVSSGRISKIFPLKLFEKCLRFAKLFEAYFPGVENVSIIHLRFASLFIFHQTHFDGR